MSDSLERDDDFEDRSRDIESLRAYAVADTGRLTRRWIEDAMTAGSRVNTAYVYGKFPLGEDAIKCLPAFEYDQMRGQSSDAGKIEDQRARAYHRLQDFLLERHEYFAAWQVAKKLSGIECWWYAYRHFFLWRVMAAAIAGDIAFNGSSPWRQMLMAPHGDWAVGLFSVLLILSPPVFAEAFQAPVHALRYGKERRTRLGIVWLNAVVVVLAIAGAEWILATYACPGCCDWKEVDNWRYHLLAASAAQALGYVINLVWRDRSLAGPA